MKHHVRSTIALTAAILALFATIASCSRKTMPDEEASLWVAAYSPAHIDMDSKIRVELTDLAISKLDTERPLGNALRFSPNIKGEARLSADKRFIDFAPDRSLKQGEKYECRIDLKALTEVDSLADFAFCFFVDRREARFENVAAAVDPDNAQFLTVRGWLAYNTVAGDSIAADSAIIACDYPGAKIIMDKKAEKQRRGFRVTGIKRHEKDKELTLSVNPIAGFSGSSLTIAVPSVSDFRLLSAERVEAADPYINMEFSTPLSSQQELDGLITIDNVPGLRIERSGTNVKAYYPPNSISDLTLRISDLLKNSDGRCLDSEIERHFAQEVIPPAVELPFEGSILPDNRNLKLPFRAVNLAAVDVEVVKIFPANVMAFLQQSDLYDSGELRRFGRLVYHKTVRLDADKSLDLHRWQNFSIDLKDMFARERGAIYNIRLTFRRAYSLYGRAEAEDFEEIDGLTDADKRIWDREGAYIYRDAPDFDWSKYNWEETKDPTKDSYYMVEWERMPEANLVASNLGLIVKHGSDNAIKAIVTDIPSSKPAGGVRVTAYNFQLQKIGLAVSNESGFADFRTEGRPFMVTASDGLSSTYLKVTADHELSTNNFDVGGKTITGGIKGFAYGDRGVWRPGDDVHLTLIIEDKNKRLPPNHPVVMELYNPADQLYDRQTLAKGVDNFYAFCVSTDEKAPTGLWTARFKVGNETFYHPVRIETIKPNRLKVGIRTPEYIQANSKTQLGLDARWLTGPAAKDMRASLEMTLYPNPAPFDQYKDFTFKNPLVSYESSRMELFSGALDSLGSITRCCTIGADANSPGMLQANLTAKVAEPGGDASIASKQVPFSPFGVYVGIDLRQKDYETDQDLAFPVVALNQAGAKMKTRELDYKIYRLDWGWWWEGGADALNRYVKSSTADVVASGTVTALNGMAEVPFRVEYPEWGKYLVLVRDTKGRHATGGIISVDWPQWRGRSGKGMASGSAELSFALDKQQYEAGETASVYLPQCEGAHVLLSIENGSQVLRRIWVPLSGQKETKYQITVDNSMAPNFYVSATMLRPHNGTDFDTPLRLFGIQSAKVVNPSSILHPVIEMPDELHPRQPFPVKISEKDNKPMTYTLAIVDEGLLDITNFKTPRPWQAMNQKEALGIRTWDMYDDVIGAFGSNFRSIARVGGDEALRKAAGKEKRFNPVVKFIGPFTIAGGSKTHKIVLPNYVGSVRAMVVAAHGDSYGSADKTVNVTSPLMMLATLPRALANCDTIDVPVNIFAMDQQAKSVAVSIDVDGPARVCGAKSRSLKFAEPGEQLANFRIVCDNTKEGKARIVLTASANGHIARDTVYIGVANPMPAVRQTIEKTVPANGSADFAWAPGNADEVSLQIASMPALNFAGAAQFMSHYPHLCTEQLSSKALFMLYGREYLDAEGREKCQKDLPSVLKAIRTRQSANGGFAYWPGQAEENDWATSMAGLALAEASRQGFRVDKDCIEKWKSYQQAKARDYRHSIDTDITQAMRLYSLAVAQCPQTSAMNRLRESKQLSRTAAFCLASCYAETGRTDVAKMLIERAARTEFATPCDMFGSAMRDEAIALEAYALCGMSAEALPLARKIASQCTGAAYVTQDIAFATIAMKHLSELMGSGSNSAKVSQPGKAPQSIAGFSCLKNVALDPGSGTVAVQNLNGNGSLNLSLLMSRRPSAGEQVGPYADGLRIGVTYIDMKGNPISVARLKQDAEFCAIITVTNLSGEDIDNIALTHAIPSGWEIWNERLCSPTGSGYDNCDIRDCSSNFYFGLKSGESRTARIRLRAAYAGDFLLPPTICEDMYNPACRAMTASRRVSVTR